ncbi:universal stress protein [Halorubrum vacuolatum]|uniref:Nucleotide-binding universal stress protein, UspA family n=1 Tax=Halorubrum vacuolatum TaxID=63740 RepID=A0A238VPU7_HALVU|nr:universal stress protein [Halorubrum vacuolatum]SNR36167.1 Nucleotide-binding universal stress protein, UspA family [Halorubrum vacuolatum]
MYTILMAVGAERDPAKYAAEAVSAFPGRDAFSVIVLNVQREFEAVGEGGRVRSADLYDEAAFPESVDLAVSILEDAGIDTTKRRAHGDPAERILDVAAERDVDQIVIGTENRSPAGKALFGSVMQSVILDTELPVTVISRD